MDFQEHQTEPPTWLLEQPEGWFECHDIDHAEGVRGAWMGHYEALFDVDLDVWGVNKRIISPRGLILKKRHRDEMNSLERLASAPKLATLKIAERDKRESAAVQAEAAAFGHLPPVDAQAAPLGLAMLCIEPRITAQRPIAARVARA